MNLDNFTVQVKITHLALNNNYSLTQLTIQLNFSGRMGNVKQALKLITEKLRDVNRAIDFCKDQNEPELWEDLIQSSLDKPCKILIFI